MTFSASTIGASIATALAAAWAFVKSLFTKQGAQIIWKILLSSAKTAVMQKINDGSLQSLGLQVAKTLTDMDLTGSQKATLFNQIVVGELKKTGKEIGSSSLNALRELALQAVNVQAEKGEVIEVSDAIATEAKAQAVALSNASC